MESEVECTKRLSQWQKMSGTESQEGTIPGKATFYSQFVFLLCSSFLKMEKPCVSLSVGGSLVSLVVLGDSSLKTVICIVKISGFESLITFNYIISYYINLHHITVISSHGFSWFIWHPPTPLPFSMEGLGTVAGLPASCRHGQRSQAAAGRHARRARGRSLLRRRLCAVGSAALRADRDATAGHQGVGCGSQSRQDWIQWPKPSNNPDTVGRNPAPPKGWLKPYK